MASEKIYGKFTQKGIVSEIRSSAEEDTRMMRQMSFLPDGLKNEMTVIVSLHTATQIVLDVPMAIEAQKKNDLYFLTRFEYV
jgi:hypothetical protein